MSIGSGGPFEPVESATPSPERGRPLAWWQIVLILAPFAAIIGFAAVYGK
jgi:hypothetical protein